MDLVTLRAVKKRKQEAVDGAVAELQAATATLEAQTQRVEQCRPLWVRAQEQQDRQALLTLVVDLMRLKLDPHSSVTLQTRQARQYCYIERKDYVGASVVAKVNRQGDFFWPREASVLNVFTADFDTLCKRVWRCHY